MHKNRNAFILTIISVIATLAFSTQAWAQIERPGAHPAYSVELEPHALLQWDVDPWNDEGFGLGLRVSIPVVDNGPVTTINNSLALGFGLDTAFSGDDRCRWRPSVYYDECDAFNILFPVVAQWNFFFTDVVSAFVELGLAIQYEHWDAENCAGSTCVEYDDDDIDPELMFFLGARFIVSKSIAIPIRIGWPYFAVGPSFLF